MRRWAIRICFFLVLGAIINVALAWACACWCDTGESSRNLPDVWPVPVDSNWPTKPWLSFQYRGIGVQETHAYVRIDPENDKVARLAVLNCGWPLPSLYAARTCVELSQSHNEPLSYDFPRCHRLLDGIVIPNGLSRYPFHRCLPTRPIWPGFAINTVFYAVVLWLLFVAPFALRRRWRIRRGLCPKCAYDLRGTREDATSCPECGASVNRMGG